MGWVQAHAVVQLDPWLPMVDVEVQGGYLPPDRQLTCSWPCAACMHVVHVHMGLEGAVTWGGSRTMLWCSWTHGFPWWMWRYKGGTGSWLLVLYKVTLHIPCDVVHMATLHLKDTEPFSCPILTHRHYTTTRGGTYWDYSGSRRQV
jgi:hypothetical protein